jgi:hypothetical protein
LAYLPLALIGRFGSDRIEFYPFFAWTLYSRVPSKVEQPTIYMTAFKNKPLDKEVRLVGRPEMLKLPADNLLEIMRALQQARKNKDQTREELLLQEIDHSLLYPGSKYRVVLEEYYSYERLKTNKTIKITELCPERAN